MRMIHDITKIDIWFIDKLAILVEMEHALKAAGRDLTPELLKEAKRIEFPDNVIASLTGHDAGGDQGACVTTTASALPTRW